MRDAECVELLQWALPRLRLRWAGFRRVRARICKRVGRRIRALGLEDARAYRSRLEEHPAEWRELDAMCHIPISRFHRDRAVFAALGDAVLPELAERALARGEGALRAWSVGCASGEEPYSLVLLWRMRVGPRFPGLALRIEATDADPALVERARCGRFGASSLRELPREWVEPAFEPCDGDWRARPWLREAVEFRVEDVRERLPDAAFDLVLCRNLVFTYYEPELQRELLDAIAARLRVGGALVLGAHESLPEPAPGFRAWGPRLPIHRRIQPSERSTSSAFSANSAICSSSSTRGG